MDWKRVEPGRVSFKMLIKVLSGVLILLTTVEIRRGLLI